MAPRVVPGHNTYDHLSENLPLQMKPSLLWQRNTSITGVSTFNMGICKNYRFVNLQSFTKLRMCMP